MWSNQNGPGLSCMKYLICTQWLFVLFYLCIALFTRIDTHCSYAAMGMMTPLSMNNNKELKTRLCARILWDTIHLPSSTVGLQNRVKSTKSPNHSHLASYLKINTVSAALPASLLGGFVTWHIPAYWYISAQDALLLLLSSMSWFYSF